MAYLNTTQRDALLNDNEKTDAPMEYHTYLGQGDLTRLRARLLFLTAAATSVLTIILTLSLHMYLWSTSRANTDASKAFLPGLDLPPLGTVHRVFDIQPIFRKHPNNNTREAWFKYFPIGNGYVNMDQIRAEGPVADFLLSYSNDGSGRYGLAMFHSMHCLHTLYEDFYAALDGNLKEPSSHGKHCWDYLRESILCAADTSFEPVKAKFDGGGGGHGVDGFGSVHQCRDYEAVFEWAEKFRYSDEMYVDFLDR